MNTPNRCIEFLVTTFGNDTGDIVEIETEDEDYIYYTDDFDRWCCLAKYLEDKIFVFTNKVKCYICVGKGIVIPDLDDGLDVTCLTCKGTGYISREKYEAMMKKLQEMEK